MCYQWIFFQGHLLDSGEKRKREFQKDGETSVLLSLKNTANILFLHRSLGPFNWPCIRSFYWTIKSRSRGIASSIGAVESVVAGTEAHKPALLYIANTLKRHELSAQKISWAPTKWISAVIWMQKSRPCGRGEALSTVIYLCCVLRF